jgi:hypothetical protein
MRVRTYGSGSDLDRFMGLLRSNNGKMSTKFFGDIPIMLVGTHAANAFMPPRHADDVDVLVGHDRFDETERLLESDGWTKLRNLIFQTRNSVSMEVPGVIRNLAKNWTSSVARKLG